MPAVIEGVDRRTVLSTVFLDVLVTEEINLPGKVTRYPVEDGTEISENITVEAETVRLAGNIALADAAAIESGATEAGSKMVDVLEALRGLRKERALVTVSSGQIVYQDYAFESLVAKRGSGGEGGNWLAVEAELVKVTKVQLQTAEVPERAQGPAAGRTGQTNKAAGKANSNANANQNQPRNNSLAKGGLEAGRELLDQASKMLKGIGGTGATVVP